jgi:hypothetical protein
MVPHILTLTAGSQSRSVLSGLFVCIYLFIYDLSKDAISSPYYVASNGTSLKDAVVAYFKALSRHLP